MKKRIGVIGYGNMGSAIAERLKAAGYQVSVFDKDKNKTKNLEGLKVTKNITDAIKQTDVVILAIKPQDFDIVLNEAKGILSGQLIISIAAGIPTAYIERVLGKVKVVRTMPNLPAKIGKGMICLSKGKYATEADLGLAQKLFSHLGDTMKLDEKKMDAATAVTGSGPGFFYKLIQIENINPNNLTEIKEFATSEFIPACTASATSIGFSDTQAKVLVVSTTNGTIDLLKSSGLTPKQLENAVKSRKGTTEAGLNKLRGIASLKQAIKAAFKRARELSKKE